MPFSCWDGGSGVCRRLRCFIIFRLFFFFSCFAVCLPQENLLPPFAMPLTAPDTPCIFLTFCRFLLFLSARTLSESLRLPHCRSVLPLCFCGQQPSPSCACGFPTVRQQPQNPNRSNTPKQICKSDQQRSRYKDPEVRTLLLDSAFMHSEPKRIEAAAGNLNSLWSQDLLIIKNAEERKLLSVS